MRRHELTDAQWEVLGPLLPGAKRRGGQWRDHRSVVNGILWVLGTGAAWRDLPERYGPWQTAWRRFNAWRKDGTWDKVLHQLQHNADARGHVDWELWCVDSTNIRAMRPAGGARKKGGR